MGLKRRKIVQVTFTPKCKNMVALCDDGTVWIRNKPYVDSIPEWLQVDPLIPQDGE
mgnify:FL=1